MTSIKITGTPTAAAKSALEPHVKRIYDRPGVHVMAIVELLHFERLQPAPNSDAEAVVRMKIVGCEVPNEEQEPAVRAAQSALFLARTARGTLDEEGMLNLDEDTLRLTAGRLLDVEAARLRAGLAHWTRYAERIATQASKFSTTEMAHELQAVADGLTSVLRWADTITEEES